MARRSLSQEVKDGILSDLAAGISPVTIAANRGVSIPTVYNYAKRTVTVAEPVSAEVTSAAVVPAVATATRKRGR